MIVFTLFQNRQSCDLLPSVHADGTRHHVSWSPVSPRDLGPQPSRPAPPREETAWGALGGVLAGWGRGQVRITLRERVPWRQPAPPGARCPACPPARRSLGSPTAAQPSGSSRRRRTPLNAVGPLGSPACLSTVTGSVALLLSSCPLNVSAVAFIFPSTSRQGERAPCSFKEEGKISGNIF